MGMQTEEDKIMLADAAINNMMTWLHKHWFEIQIPKFFT